MIDTHTHFYDSRFNGDRDEVLKKAIENNVTKLVVPGTDMKSHEKAMALCKAYPNVCYPAIGLHPTSVKEDYETELDFIEQQLTKNSFVAIGEIGIDCHWSLDYIVQQRDAFIRQLKLAEKYNLPIIIHAREAFDEIFPILDKIYNPKIKGVFHSFAGTTAHYRKIKKYGTFKIGIGGVVTFKNSDLSTVVDMISIDDIVLETDSPYLAPHPHRGQRNDSSYIPIIARKIAEIKGISLNEVDKITTENAESLFSI